MEIQEHHNYNYNNNNIIWRNTILQRLLYRDKTQATPFIDIITYQNHLFDSVNALRAENIQLTVQNEKLKSGGGGHTLATSTNPSASSERIQWLEQKLLVQQEELTNLHRRRGENAQQIINLNEKLQEAEKTLASKDESISLYKSTITGLESDVSRLRHSLKELETLEQHLRDEHQALQITCAALEDKLRKAQEENRQLIERLIKYKAKDADKMNEENETFTSRTSKSSSALFMQTITKVGLGLRGEKMRRELEEAVREGVTGSCDERTLLPPPGTGFHVTLGVGAGVGAKPFYYDTLPNKPAIKFDAHDGEVNAVKWCPTDRLIATGGADRKVKLWDISQGECKSRGVLVGSNAGVMSVDFDTTGTLILGASNDFASRVWTVADLKLRHTLTGHSGKVMAAKFLGEPSKVITGSHDRTLKIWDLRSRACIETKFAGSSCNDLVTSDATIISGHFDKSVRFWDIRTDATANHVLLQGKVTSLDLSRDADYLLACVRDDTLKLLDLRMNAIVGSFSSDAFKVGCDWSRACFSPDGRHIAVGGADGSVFVWGVSSAKLESVLKDHSAAVAAVCWRPHGGSLVSVDRAKKAIVWGDF